jgi:hypothetical protein
MTPDVYTDLFDADLDEVAVNLDAAIRSAAYPLPTASCACWPPFAGCAVSKAGRCPRPV